jgi:hypothetical protein
MAIEECHAPRALRWSLKLRAPSWERGERILLDGTRARSAPYDGAAHTAAVLARTRPFERWREMLSGLCRKMQLLHRDEHGGLM